jgi:hypothetical protein
MTRSRMGFLLGCAVLVGSLLGARVAFSGKVSDTAGAGPVATGPSPMPEPNGCQDTQSFDLAQKLVAQVIDAHRWTARDHERIGPLFHSLRTDQKIEILKRIGAALDSHRLVLEKGTRIF